jgi:hypothetical protein
MRRAISGAFVVIVMSLLAGGRARAQEGAAYFGEGHNVVVSAERLFGYVHSSEKLTANGTDQTTSSDNFSLLANPLSFLAVYSTPRLAIDVFVADRFSLGASASFFTVSQSQTGSTTSPSLTGFMFAPRFGYAVALGPAASLWPRLGFTFAHLSDDSGSGTPGTDQSLYAFTVELPFVFTIGQHFFLSAMPFLDLGVGGSTSTPTGITGMSMSVDEKLTDVGLTTALGGFF